MKGPKLNDDEKKKTKDGDDEGGDDYSFELTYWFDWRIHMNHCIYKHYLNP